MTWPERAQAVDSKLSLETAMSLYGLEESELFWEKKRDTKLLLAWNRNTFVVAFRGTASLANAMADVQVLPVAGLQRYLLVVQGLDITCITSALHAIWCTYLISAL